MADADEARTHTALALKREGKVGRWPEIGVARAEKDGSIRVFLDRTPIGEFSGYVDLFPIGSAAAVADPCPQRPAPPSDGDEEDRPLRTSPA